MRIAPILATAALLTGCASSSTVSPVWSTAVPDGAVVHVAPEAGAAVVADGLDVRLLSAQDGDLLMQKEDPARASVGGFFGEMVKESIGVGGLSLADMDADRHDVVFLGPAQAGGDGLLLLFDYSLDTDAVRAYDLATGAERWVVDRYAWSTADLDAVKGAAVDALASAIGGSATAMDAALVEAERSERAAGMFAPLPAHGALLAKTMDGLYLLDAATGEERWAAQAGIPGNAILHAAPIDEATPSGDLLVVMATRGAMEMAAGSEEVLRLDPATGAVRWRTPYDGVTSDYLRGVEQIGPNAVLQFWNGSVQAFDASTGERRMQTAEGMGDAVTADQPTLFVGNDVYAVHTTNGKVGAPPDQVVRKFDAASGEMLWASEPFEKVASIGDLDLAGGTVVVRTAGPRGTLGHADRALYGLDPATGEQRWMRRLNGGRDLTPVALLGDELLVGGAHADSLWALDAATGQTLRAVSVGEGAFGDDDLGDIVHLYDRGTDLVAYFDKGVATMAKADFAVTGSLAYAGHSLGADGDGRFLVVPFSKGIVKSDLDGLDLIELAPTGPVRLGTLKDVQTEDYREMPPTVFGRRYQMAPDGSAVYVLTTKGRLAKYALL